MFKCIYGYCQRNPNVPRISDKSERSEKKTENRPSKRHAIHVIGFILMMFVDTMETLPS